MRRLYLRIVSSIMLAVLAGSVAVTLLMPRLAVFFQDAVPQGNLASIAEHLENIPPPQWPEELRKLQLRSRMRLRIVDSATFLTEARNGSHRGAEPEGSTRSLPALYLPVHQGTHFLIATPSGEPPLLPALVPALVFVFVLTVTASAVVGLPLARRLQRLQHAVGELGGGNWAMRLDANAEGALSELAGSINRMAGQLQQQFQEREALLQAVSHELGTPLARMRFQLTLIEGELRGQGNRQRLTAMKMDMDELDELSTELVSWMEPSSRSESRDLFKLAPVVNSLVELECLDSEDKRRRIHVRVLVPSDLQLTADRRQFQRVLENLLRNAMRYAQSSIVIEAVAFEKTVSIEVRDDGPGISPEHRDRVLEPFVRVDSSVNRSHHRGLGLGLAIVRRIVEAHGGSISISEAPEGGTSVLTRWPDGPPTPAL